MKQTQFLVSASKFQDKLKKQQFLKKINTN